MYLGLLSRSQVVQVPLLPNHDPSSGTRIRLLRPLGYRVVDAVLQRFAVQLRVPADVRIRPLGAIGVGGLVDDVPNVLLAQSLQGALLSIEERSSSRRLAVLVGVEGLLLEVAGVTGVGILVGRSA